MNGVTTQKSELRFLPRKSALSLAIRKILIVGIAGQAGPLTAIAQNADPSTLEEVIVTAKQQFRTRSSSSGANIEMELIETPQAITVIDESLFRMAGLRNLGDTAQVVPGLSSRGYSGFSPRLESRGITVSGRFGYKINGVEHLNGAFPIDIVAVDRVESVRGVSSVIFGQANYGGLINTVLKEPSPEFEFSATAEAGSWGTQRGEFSVSNALNDTGTLRARVDYAYDKRGRFVDFSEDVTQVVHGAIAFDASDRTHFNAHIYHGERDSNSDFGFPLVNENGELAEILNGDVTNIPRKSFWGAPQVSPGLFDPGTQTKGYLLLGELRHEFQNEIESTLRVAKEVSDSRIRQPYAFYLYDDGSTLIYDYLTEFSSTTHVVNAKVAGDVGLFGRTHKWLVDGYYRETEEPGEYYQSKYLGTVNPFTGDYSGIDIQEIAFPGSQVFNDTEIIDTGLSLVTILNPIERLTVLLGIRFQSFERLDDEFSPEGEFLETLTDVKESDYVGRLGFTYEINPNLFVYASYSEGLIFQTARFSDAKGRGTLPPELGEQYELGVKAELFDERLSAGVTLYQLDRQNVPIRDPDLATTGDSNLPGSIPAKGGQFSGVEIEAIGEPLPGLNVLFAYSYQDNELSDARVGSIVPHVPESEATLLLSYEFLDGPLRGFRFGGGVTRTSKRFGNRIGTLEYPSYTRVDLSAGYQLGEHVQLYVNVRNVNNADIMSGLNNGFDSGLFGNTYHLSREVIGGIRYTF